MSTGTAPPPTTVVLIHGLWMTPLAWEHWVERYEARGCTVLTPGYPGIGQGEAGLHALRGNPDVVAGIGVREVMDYLTRYIGKLDARPVIMGHSFGGTFAQRSRSWTAVITSLAASPGGRPSPTSPSPGRSRRYPACSIKRGPAGWKVN